MNTIKEKIQEREVFILIACVIYVVSLFLMNYFKFDILNIAWVLISIAILFLSRKSPWPKKQWLAIEGVILVSLIVAFYSFMNGNINSQLYLCIPVGCLIMALVFRWHWVIPIFLFVDIFTTLMNLSEGMRYISLYMNFVYYIIISFIPNDLKIYKK